MTDNLDHRTNTYQVYSKDPGDLQEVLVWPGIFSQKQHLQIQREGMFGAICGKEMGPLEYNSW